MRGVPVVRKKNRHDSCIPHLFQMKQEDMLKTQLRRVVARVKTGEVLQSQEEVSSQNNRKDCQLIPSQMNSSKQY